ncbi:MAG: nickel-dependent lactate racemase [Deltaproteobacteria bacterium]|nr:nickel-dependent lactate racemase [Deltaproteobacteria bacterium]MBW1977928.1 nickel-dependent lactate racemase [Deltaproteobacteria bacterium]MBW2299555.1 nickel-dependent lactate racemase [Deltaproteobacteria bacterium]RLB31156.1 MAG: nickel-dependent lactate racemase [Deltaproteobacteria bacterium]
MRADIAKTIKSADTTKWKKIAVEFGDEFIEILVPPDCITLSMKKMPSLANSKQEILAALNNPIGSPPLNEIIHSKKKPPHELTVCITVSDITRPVPYKGENGILLPLLEIIGGAGVRKENIVIVIGNGMHRPSTLQERIFMYGEQVVSNYRIVDHDCEDLSSQVLAAHTSKGTDVYVNRIFYESDVKIVTGLVESHFMTGVSGGRKAVCPALVNTKTIEKFHGVEFLEHPNATNMVLDGNPCHEEAIEVASTVGVDFMISTTLDKKLRITGVFAGDLIQAHLKAFEAMKEYVQIPVDQPFDIVVTHAGYVGRNHYQSVKAAVGAMPAVKENGLIVMLANNVDPEPIGSLEYKTLLHLFKILGPKRYLSILQHPDWVFTKDQWEPEMWGKPIRKVGEEGLIYCAPQLQEKDYEIVPGVSGYEFLESGSEFSSDKQKGRAMFQNAVIYAFHHPKFEGKKPTMAFIEEGPYAVPIEKKRLRI